MIWHTWLFWEAVRDIPVLGWWATTPAALACGSLFWNFLSLLTLAPRRAAEGKAFASRRQRRLFFLCVGATTGIQLLIYLYVGLIYVSGLTLKPYGFPVIYFLSLALILVTAAYFCCRLVLFTAETVRAVRRKEI
ncbi:MAG: hypothetical protein ACOX8R_04165 [Bacillota bacterium]|jgi:hypothetical protein